MVNDAGTLVEHIAYSPFGQQVQVPSSYTNSGLVNTALPAFGYTGTYTDPVTGFQLHGVRWYDPASQRWLTQDPSGLGPDSNPYRYVGNMPTEATDPTGLGSSKSTKDEPNIVSNIVPRLQKGKGCYWLVIAVNRCTAFANGSGHAVASRS